MSAVDADDPVAQLRPEHFEALLGQELAIDFGAGPVAAGVLSVEPMRSPSLRAGGGFSVWLRAPGAPATQGTFLVELPGHGTLELFCCPRRREGEAIVFELVFN